MTKEQIHKALQAKFLNNLTVNPKTLMPNSNNEKLDIGQIIKLKNKKTGSMIAYPKL